MVSINYKVAPYSKASYSVSPTDTAFRRWTDQQILSFGLSWSASKYLTVMAGYRNIPEVFVPNGAAIKSHGPEANSYNAGLGIHTEWGTLDLACEYRQLKYYDSYYSNTNYAFESKVSLLLGYTYSF